MSTNSLEFKSLSFPGLSDDLSAKLRIQDHDNIIKNALNKALESNFGKQIITDVLKTARKVEIIFDDKSKTEVYDDIDESFTIYLNNIKSYYYLTKATIDELPENFKEFFEDSNLKKIGNEFTLPQALVHEFCHIYNCLSSKTEYETRINSPSLKNDIPNLEEERTILEENKYLNELKKSERVDYLGCCYPNYNSLEKNQPMEEALIHYIFNGAHVDALHLANKIEKNKLNELIKNILLNAIFVGELDLTVEKKTAKYISDYFKDIIAALVIFNVPALMFPALKWAALNGYLNVVKYLKENGADINQTDDEGGNALIFAALNGHLNVVKYLKENGTDINHIDYYGNTAFKCATYRNRFDVVTYLNSNSAKSYVIFY